MRDLPPTAPEPAAPSLPAALPDLALGEPEDLDFDWLAGAEVLDLFEAILP